MTITKEVLTRSNSGPMSLPHCRNCTKRKAKKHVDALAEYLAKVKPIP